MARNFNAKTIASIAGTTVSCIYGRARALGYVTNHNGFTADQAYSLVHYERKQNRRRVVDQESERQRLQRAIDRIQSRSSRTVVA